MKTDRWIHLRSRQLREFRTLRVREDRYRFTPRDREGDFVVCESADWVLIIALTPDDQVVLARQFRHGIGHLVLEIPGGVMEEGESPLESATRELCEETGFVAEQLEALPPFLPNPALNTAQCHVIVARGCRRVTTPEFDSFEDIEVELRPLSEIAQMIHSGELLHALTIAAFSVANLHKKVLTLSI